MAWQTPLDSWFSPQYQTPPPELLSENFQPQYQATDYLTNPLAFKYQKELLNAKNAWNTAEDDIKLRQQLINQGALTDDQKQGELNKIALLKQHQQDLNNAANMTRKTAGTLGIDLTGFGADNTAEESQQYFLNNNARAMQGLLNLPSVQSQQKNYYEQMKKAGLSDRLARKAAAQKFDEFRENNVNNLRNGLFNYGVNSDGVINEFGVQILGRMANENPYAVETLANLLPNLKNAYNEENANYRQEINNQAQALMNAEKLKATMETAAAQRQAQMQMDAAKRKFEAEKFNSQHNLNIAKHNLDIDKFNAEQEKTQTEIALKIAELDNKIKTNPLAVSRGEAASFLNNSFGEVINYINNGNTAAAGEYMENLEEYFGNPLEFKENTYLSPVEMEHYRQIRQLIKDYLDKKNNMTLEEFNQEIEYIRDPRKRESDINRQNWEDMKNPPKQPPKDTMPPKKQTPPPPNSDKQPPPPLPSYQNPVKGNGVVAINPYPYINWKNF